MTAKTRYEQAVSRLLEGDIDDLDVLYALIREAVEAHKEWQKETLREGGSF